MGSSGYGSHGSNGSHEQLVSISSSSESNGNVTAGKSAEETGKAKPPRTFQEICKGVHMLKNQDSQVCLRSPPSSPSPSPSKPEQKRTTDSEFSLISPNRHHSVFITGSTFIVSEGDLSGDETLNFGLSTNAGLDTPIHIYHCK